MMPDYKQQMRDMARGEVEGELEHYFDDMDWGPRHTLERLVEWWDEEEVWHPNSKEAKSVKKMLVEFEVVEEVTEEELAQTTVYSTSNGMEGRNAKEWFRFDGKMYVFDSWSNMES